MNSSSSRYRPTHCLQKLCIEEVNRICTGKEAFDYLDCEEDVARNRLSYAAATKLIISRELQVSPGLQNLRSELESKCEPLVSDTSRYLQCTDQVVAAYKKSRVPIVRKLIFESRRFYIKTLAKNQENNSSAG